MCQQGVDETLEHLVLGCNRYQNTRTNILDVIEEIGVTQQNEMSKMGSCRQMAYLLRLDAKMGSGHQVVEIVKEFLGNFW